MIQIRTGMYESQGTLTKSFDSVIDNSTGSQEREHFEAFETPPTKKSVKVKAVKKTAKKSPTKRPVSSLETEISPAEQKKERTKKVKKKRERKLTELKLPPVEVSPTIESPRNCNWALGSPENYFTSENFQQLLQHPFGRDNFHAFLRNSFCDENLLFVEAVNRFKQLPSDSDEYKTLAEEVTMFTVALFHCFNRNICRRYTALMLGLDLLGQLILIQKTANLSRTFCRLKILTNQFSIQLVIFLLRCAFTFFLMKPSFFSDFQTYK